jgi:hypothetical protein
VNERELDFVAAHPGAAMITVGADGFAKSARVAIGMLDGDLVSSGTQERRRTARLRDDPRCTLYVPGGEWQWLTIEARVSLVEGEDAVEPTVRFFRQVQGRPSGPLSWFGGEREEDAFRQILRDEGRLLYRFEITRTYGMF